MPTTLPAASGGPRYLVISAWKWDAGDDLATRFVPLVDSARAVGFNAVRVHLPWYTVEATPGVYEHLELFDARLDCVIRDLGLKAVISIDLTRRRPDEVVPAAALQQDDAGMLAHGVNDRYMMSFASDAVVQAAADFVRFVVDRYLHRYGADAVLAYNITYSLYCESEYWVGGRLLDYSPAARQGFRRWLGSRFGTVAAVNADWSTDYSSLDEIEPPTSFAGKIGLRWYQFRHAMLKQVNDRMAQAVHGVAAGLKVGQQYGSVWDSQAAARGTIAFPALCEQADLVCVDDAPDYPFAWSMDLLRGSLPGKEIANECDRPAIGSDSQYLRQAQVSFAHGAACLFFANWDDDPDRLRAHDHALFTPIRERLLTNPVTVAISRGRLDVSALTLLREGSEGAQASHRLLSAGGEECVDVVLHDDLSWPEEANVPTVVGFRDDADGPPAPGHDTASPAEDRPPRRSLLTWAYPNPANGGMTLVCELPLATAIEVVVYGLDGQRVRLLAAGVQGERAHRVYWDGRDDQGRPAASGVYLCRFHAGDEISTTRVVLLR
ncbi:MAG: beta-galactosidase [Candidatus Latescibacterota bacterium]